MTGGQNTAYNRPVTKDMLEGTATEAWRLEVGSESNTRMDSVVSTDKEIRFSFVLVTDMFFVRAYFFLYLQVTRSNNWTQIK